MNFDVSALDSRLRLISIINCAGSTYVNGLSEKLKSCLFEIIALINQRGESLNFEIDHTVIVLGDSGIRDIVGFNTSKAISDADFSPFGIMSLGKALEAIKKICKTPQYTYGGSLAAILLLSDGIFDYGAVSALQSFNSLTEFKHIPKIAVCSDVIDNSDEHQNLSKFAGDKVFDTLSVQKIAQEIVDAYLDNKDKKASDVSGSSDDFDLDF